MTLNIIVILHMSVFSCVMYHNNAVFANPTSLRVT